MVAVTFLPLIPMMMGGSHFLRQRALVRTGIAFMSSTAAKLPSLDAKLVAESPEVVEDMLKLRRAPEKQFEALSTIGRLQKQRVDLANNINKQLGIRKQLSPRIGALIKESKEDEVAELKKQVAEASDQAKRMEAEIQRVEEERDALVASLPNLLDPRVPDGPDESANECVLSWEPEEGIVRQTGEWHDDVASKLGGLDTERAAKLSGARFSVRRAGGRGADSALMHSRVLAGCVGS